LAIIVNLVNYFLPQKVINTRNPERRIKMQQIQTAIFSLFLIFGLIIGMAGESAASRNLVLAHTGGPGTAVDLTYIKFKELVEAKTNGEIIIDLFGAGSLAGDQTAVEGAQMGTIAIGSSGTNNMAPFTSQFLFGDLPYVMDSVESSHKVWGGEIGAELRESVGKELNLKGLFFVDVGSFRVLGNNRRPVHTPEDLRGLKIRATATPVEQAILRAWGASPTPVSWPEVYMALEQQVVEGTYVQPLWTVSAKQHEAMKYYTETGGVQNMHLCFMSKIIWDTLTESQQKAILEAAQEAQTYNFEIAPQMVDGLKEEMISIGGKFYYPTDEEMEKWMGIKDAIWEQFSDRIDMDFVQRVVEAQRQ